MTGPVHYRRPVNPNGRVGHDDPDGFIRFIL